MRILRVHDVLSDRILVSRESARLLEDALRGMMESAGSGKAACDPTPWTVDFEGVEGMAPSFLDELLSIFESFLGTQAAPSARRLIVAHPPTRLSLKFEAVARGHGMSVRALADGSWLLADGQDSAA